MLTQLRKLKQNHLVRFMTIEILLIALIGLVCLIARFQISTALMIVGGAVIFLQFPGPGRSINVLGMGQLLGSYVFEKQYLDEIRRHEFQRTSESVNELEMIGLILVIVGLLIEFVL